MLAAAVTKLLELQAASGRLFVLRRRVIPLLAHLALQCNNFPHSKNPSRRQPSPIGLHLAAFLRFARKAARLARQALT
jgi:hypothetical protein